MKGRDGWSRRFDDPIPLPEGRELVTLHQAGEYITKLPKAEHDAPHWLPAAEMLLTVAEGRGHDVRRHRHTPGDQSREGGG